MEAPTKALSYRMTNEQNRHRNRETSKAMLRIAESRKCPKCGRKAALKSHSDEFSFGSYCRWEDCGYEHIMSREEESG
jgi:ribosomal protein S27AE